MRLIEAEKAKDVIHEYFKSLMVKDASGADVYKLAVGIVSCLEHDANLMKAIDELPSAEQEAPDINVGNMDIIRCPDCYYNDGTAYCELHFRNVKGKDFCSWAERRKDATD